MNTMQDYRRCRNVKQKNDFAEIQWGTKYTKVVLPQVAELIDIGPRRARVSIDLMHSRGFDRSFRTKNVSQDGYGTPPHKTESPLW